MASDAMLSNGARSGRAARAVALDLVRAGAAGCAALRALNRPRVYWTESIVLLVVMGGIVGPTWVAQSLEIGGW